MSRGSLKKILMERGGFYNHLKDLGNVISVRVVVYFNSDVESAIALIRTAFVLNEVQEEDAAREGGGEQFGILTRRFAIQFLPEYYERLEYQRFASIRARLEIRTVLQHSWSEMREIFDLMINRAKVPGHNLQKLAQISFLLKMADDELVRIKEQIMSQAGMAQPQTNVVAFGLPESSTPPPVQTAVAQPPPEEAPPAFQEETRIDERRRIFFVKKLEIFILNDPLIRELDRAIADHYETRLVYRESFVVSLTDVFLRIRVDDEERLREELAGNKAIILSLMKNIFGNTSRTALEFIHKGSSLLVLYYVLLARTGNFEIVKRNVKNYISLQGITLEAFANELLNHYRMAVAKEL
ncbi:MAG: hypothetical protein HQL96_12090 [Magnetococcales bacterium]|nr:hypothetical protein [Magnetococcales bacterium]